MADVMRKMNENHTVEDIDNTIDEVAEARGTYSSVNARLEAIEAALAALKGE